MVGEEEARRSSIKRRLGFRYISVARRSWGYLRRAKAFMVEETGLIVNVVVSSRLQGWHRLRQQQGKKKLRLRWRNLCDGAPKGGHRDGGGCRVTGGLVSRAPPFC